MDPGKLWIKSPKTFPNFPNLDLVPMVTPKSLNKSQLAEQDFSTRKKQLLKVSKIIFHLWYISCLILNSLSKLRDWWREDEFFANSFAILHLYWLQQKPVPPHRAFVSLQLHSSLLTLIHQIFPQVALNIGEKVGPKRNSISADELADILLRKVKKSLKEK